MLVVRRPTREARAMLHRALPRAPSAAGGYGIVQPGTRPFPFRARECGARPAARGGSSVM
jgi:hypothetical protein